MRLPCELVVHEILPTARGEVAKELVTAHGFTQTRVAAAFGITSAAISQYLKGLRGGNPLVESSPFGEHFHDCISRAADRIAEGHDVMEELCIICNEVKTCGMLDDIYRNQGEEMPLAECIECPADNISVL
ncbi:MAG: transcriptional regulator [Candidatus Methanomethylophilaceae archaeon]|nr:transcriptional regulator [Candidatus Methanomethylophilaceae archaeon]